MKKPIIALIIVLVVFGLAFFLRGTPTYESNLIDNTNTGGTTASNINEEPAQQDSSTETSTGITAEEIATHNSKDDCWVVYKGKIYDVTDYIPRHPGGQDRIARNCGSLTQFQEQFTKQHGTSKVSLLMQVGTFIGDFDVVGNLESTPVTGNAILLDDDDDDENECVVDSDCDSDEFCDDGECEDLEDE